ncbi:MAG: NAD-dependent malic enzyme [bacterium]|nr:NAD-dependent malic enzyme [bacterium]
MIRDQPGTLGRLTKTIGDTGVNIGDIVRVRLAGEYNVRDIELYASDDQQIDAMYRAVERLEGVRIEEIFDPVLEIHRGGKIRMRSTVAVERPGDVRMIYTPGVATTCLEIHSNPESVYDYTALGNTVAIVTNGTAILGLGNIGVHAGLPVMEGKAVLFDRLTGLSGIPILIPTRDVNTFVETVIQISPSFGAIQLEDIAAPECFEIERRLISQLPIPVMHDDQHGTAVVVLAALLNATRMTGQELERLTVGVVGLGAAGIGISRLLRSYGIRRVIGSDLRRDAMGRLNELGGESGSLDWMMAEADVVVATTGRPGLIAPEQVREGQIILALSNPNPEIRPEVARNAGAAFAADGRSVNNALGFPGIFRGALQARAKTIDDSMKLAAAATIADFAEPGELVPALLNPDVHLAVAEAVENAVRGGAVAVDPEEWGTS